MLITFPEVGSFIMQADKHLLSLFFVPGPILDWDKNK